MKTIIIFYEHKAREFDMCQLLKEKLEREKKIEVFILSYHWQKIDALKLLKIKRIDFILIPFAYTNEDLKFYLKFYVKNPAMIIANFHHEELTCPIWDDLILPRENMAKNTVIHFVWTNIFKGLLMTAGVDENLICVTGNVRNDLAGISSITKSEMSEKLGLDRDKRWLLFAEDRMPDKIAVLLNLENPEERIYYDEDVKSLNETIRQMQNLPNNFFDKYELIYRLHPGSNGTTLDDKRVRLVKEYAIYDWFNCIDALIVSNSTTSFEADMNGVPVFFHNPFDTDEAYLMPGVNKYYTIHNLEEIDDEVIKQAKEYEKASKVYMAYMGKNDGENANRMVAEIIKLLDKGNSTLECFSSDYSEWYYVKRIIRGNLFRIYKKTGLLSLLKKPAVFYYNQEDIPF